jgi:hypothetical protein
VNEENIVRKIIIMIDDVAGGSALTKYAAGEGGE